MSYQAPMSQLISDSAIGNCRIFLHEFIKLAQNQDFQPWHWCWPGQHQPLHSILALVTELEEHPGDPLAGETRKLVDLALAMCESSGDGGISSHEDGHIDLRPLTDSGIEAWKIIRKARDEVWEKSGLDSNSLYCPESAEDINFGSVAFRNSTTIADITRTMDGPHTMDLSSTLTNSSIAWPDQQVYNGFTWPSNHLYSFSRNYEL